MFFCRARFLVASAVRHRLAATGLPFRIHHVYAEALKKFESSDSHLGIERIEGIIRATSIAGTFP